MVARHKSSTVYSTEHGRTCPRCGWPAIQCRCAAALDQPVPERITVRMRIEKAKRRGKTVTVLEGLPRNREFLKALLTELKKTCGAGGTVVDALLEIQGDHRARLRQVLEAKGWKVKG